MKIYLLSDTHLELNNVFYFGRLIHDADVVVLAGDISADHHLLLKFLDNLSSCKRVIFVPGNHEYYKKEFDIYNDVLKKEIETKFPNVKFLLNQTISYPEFDDFVFVGGTYWTDFSYGISKPRNIRAAHQNINDFKYIVREGTNFQPYDYLIENELTKKYIQKTVGNNLNKKIIVCTHHAPSITSTLIKYWRCLTTTAFVNTDDQFILDNPNIVGWLHGHVHNRRQYQIGQCKVAVNALGYPGEEHQEGYGEKLGLLEF